MGKAKAASVLKNLITKATKAKKPKGGKATGTPPAKAPTTAWEKVRNVAKNPWSGWIASAVPMVGMPLITGTREAIEGTGFDTTWNEMIGEYRKEVMAAQASKMRQQRLEQVFQMNTQRLMMLAPDIAMELMAGRALPRGAVVLGGGQRPDLVGKLAMSMGESSAMQQGMGGGIEGLMA